MIYLYGLAEGTEAPVLPADLKGVTGPVETTVIGGDLLIYGPGIEEEILPKRRFLLAHTRVLEQFTVGHNVLPMRFGMTSPDLDRVAGLIAGQRSEIDEAFDKLRGCVELGLRVTFDRQAALAETLVHTPALAAARDRLAKFTRPPHFETAEFGRRLAEGLDRRRQIAQKTLLERVRPLCQSYVLRTPDEDTQVLALDVLVARDAEERLVTELTDALPSLDFAPGTEANVQIIGPVPAYSFVRISLDSFDKEVA